MRRRLLLTTAIAALLAALVPAAASAAARTKCPHKGAKVIAKGTGWIAWQRGRDFEDVRYVACRTATGRKVTLGQEYVGGASGLETDNVFAGNFVAVASTEWHYEQGWLEVDVWNLKELKKVSAWGGASPCEYRLGRPVLTRDGAAAFVSEGACQYTGGTFKRVLRLEPRRQAELVAEGTTIERDSLRLAGRTMSWLDGSTRQSAPLDSPGTPNPCRPTASHALAITPALRVYSVQARPTTETYVCRFSTGVPYRLEGHSEGWFLVASGERVAWVAPERRSAGGEPFGSGINLLDAATGVARVRWSLPRIGEGCVHHIDQIAIADDGVTAHSYWSRCGHEATTYQVWVTRDGSEKKVAETNRRIAPASLAINGRTLSWKAGSTVETASLD